MKNVKSCVGFFVFLSLIAASGAFCQVPCDPAPSGLVGWWRAEGNAYDSAGDNNGVITGAVSYAAGEVGQAFSITGTNADIIIPASSNLNVGLGAGLTFEAWINPRGVTNYNPVFEWNSGDGVTYAGVQMYVLSGGVYSSSPVPGTLYANVQDVNDGWHQLWSAPGVVTNGVFQHVALTYDKASGVATLYCNGAVVAQETLGSFTPKTWQNLHLGRRPLVPGGIRYTFIGLIDEASVYNRALSQSEIAAIYNAGSAGKCPIGTAPAILLQPVSQDVPVGGMTSFFVGASGSPTLTYQWHNGSGSIPGATNAMLVLSNVQPSEAGPYYVTVSNPYGSTNSASATLTVNFPPATVEVVNTTPTPPGTNVVAVPIAFVANGNENGLSFSLSFDTNRLNYLFAVAGSGATLQANASQAADGQLGIEIGLPGAQAFSAGTHQVLFLFFSTPTLTGTQPVVTAISFTNEPVGELLTDTNNNPLAYNLLNGTVTLSPGTSLSGSVVVNTSPTMTVSYNGGSALLSWPAWAAGFSLEAAGSLTPPVTWTNVPVTLQTNGANVQVTLPASGQQTYFRLSLP